MAIYHFHVKLISRSRNESSLAAAAYNTASKFTDRSKNQEFDYGRKKGVVADGILAPLNAPYWVSDREELWNKVEETERRRDAQVARAIVLALPNSLNLDQQEELLKDFLQTTFVNQGMIADFGIHYDNPNNHHAHVLLTTRRLSLNSNKFTKKVREWNTPDVLAKWREAWSNAVNRHLQNAGLNEHVDHRSYLAQGINQQPTQHLGKANFYAHKSRKAEYDRYLNNIRAHRVNSFLRRTNNAVPLINRFGMNAQTNIQEANTQQEVGVTQHPRL